MRTVSTTNPASPSLELVRERLTREQMPALMQTGCGRMPSFASFSDQEKQVIVAFLFDDGQETRIEAQDIRVSYANEIPYVMTGRHDWRDPGSFPVNKRPWASHAVDLDHAR